MLHKCDLSEISDGKIYNLNDMAKVGCNDCIGCSVCCHEMCDTIILDPYDIYMLNKGTGKSFSELLNDKLELGVYEGLTLPHLKMRETDGGCQFLNEQERCSIHKFRPGICRLFPLGRIYENDHVSYILQINECKKANKTKQRISKWIGIPEVKEYENYEMEYHKLRKYLMGKAAAMSFDNLRDFNILVLDTLFIKQYDIEKSFYDQYKQRFELLLAVRE